MTDSDIVKALECCIETSGVNCGKCPYYNNCITDENTSLMMTDTLDLINRQKAEIERLKRKLVAYEPSIDSGLFSQMLLEQKEKAEAFEKKWKAEVKSEAYREFAELLKCDWIANLYYCEDLDITDWIDNILKELVGDDDG